MTWPLNGQSECWSISFLHVESFVVMSDSVLQSIPFNSAELRCFQIKSERRTISAMASELLSRRRRGKLEMPVQQLGEMEGQ